jgi:putative ABC transport system substrate-binding protein
MHASLARISALLLLLLGLAMAAAPGAAQAPARVFRVGYLAAPSRTPDGNAPAIFREAMRDLGYVEGKNVAYEVRFAEGVLDRLPALAAEIVRSKVDVIATQGGLATMAARQAAPAVPIVIAVAAGDAVATGLISSLARPGGNITGMTDEVTQLSAKRMELLKEAVPRASRIAVIWNRDDEGMNIRYREIEKAARVLNVEVHALGVRAPTDFPNAFAEMTRRRPDALFVVTDALTNVNRRSLIDFAASQRIPTMYELGFYVRDGGLIAYGPNARDELTRAAYFVDRILKGTKPADLPAEQPTRYYLSINKKAAAALGLTVPPSLLLRADDVVE